MKTLSFIHRYEPAQTGDRPPLLLLHGNGGTEDDLLELGRAISPGSALLSPRGKVLDNGRPRFFRRLGDNVFDQEDLRRRAHELADFIAEARQAYGLGELTAVGFSNGANIAVTMMLLRPEALAHAVLLRAMIPLTEIPDVDLTGKRVLLIRGAVDPLITADTSKRLATILRAASADVEVQTLPAGHLLSQRDAALAREWIYRVNPGGSGSKPRRYNGILSCFFHGRSTFFARSIDKARAILRRVE